MLVFGEQERFEKEFEGGAPLNCQISKDDPTRCGALNCYTSDADWRFGVDSLRKRDALCHAVNDALKIEEAKNGLPNPFMSHDRSNGGRVGEAQKSNFDLMKEEEELSKFSKSERNLNWTNLMGMSPSLALVSVAIGEYYAGNSRRRGSAARSGNKELSRFL